MDTFIGNRNITGYKVGETLAHVLGSSNSLKNIRKRHFMISS